jgi:septal ring factor EnvC (AmiA/AmiB activator)
MKPFNLYIFRCGFILLHLSFTFFCFAQKQVAPKNLSDAQNNAKQLKNQIKNLTDVYNKTSAEKRGAILSVSILGIKISARQELINNINYQIKLMNAEINEKQKKYDRKKAELDTLRIHYKKMVYYAFKNKDSYNDLMFVFSSKNFNQAYQRVKYMEQISVKRKNVADAIASVQELLVKERDFLQIQIAEKKNLLGAEEQEKIILAKEKNEQEDNLSQLSSKEKQIKKELDQKKEHARELDKKINDIMNEIFVKAEKERKEREKIEKEKKDAITKSKDSKIKKDKPEANREIFKKDPDFELSEDFASNKGRLPWPVTKGAITEGFGPHNHPTIPNFIVNNAGIDITTPSRGSAARAIFEGEVTGIATMPDGNGKFIIIRHGTYLSVYTNLTSITVKKGDKIKVKQPLGDIAYSEDKGGTIMNLQIWKGQNKLNPEDWLSK